MFLLFGGDDYYPGCGMADFRGRFGTIEEAERVGRDTVFKNNWSNTSTCEWWHIVDAETLEIVRSNLSYDEINAHTKDRLKDGRKK